MTDFEKEEFWKALGRLYDSIVELRVKSEQDGENIRALARIAEIHERRLSDIERPPTTGGQ